MFTKTTEPLRRTDSTLPTRLSVWVSTLLHPFLMPLFMVSLLLFGPTQLSLVAPSVKFYLLWVTVLYTILLPLLAIGILRHLGRVSSIHIDNRCERTWPLVIGIICYLLCAITVRRIPVFLIYKLMLAGVYCELFCLGVTHYWKISLHLTTQGAITAILILLAYGCVGAIDTILYVVIVGSGLLASARLWLGCHNLLQIVAGYVCGFVLATLALLL